MLDLLYIFIGGFAGAVARYEAGSWIARRVNGPFPVGTFAINIIGSGLIGLLFAKPIPRSLLDLLDVGFTGAFTTFSTFSYETLRLIEEKLYGSAAANAVASLGIGLLALWAGMLLGRGLGV